MVIIVMVIVVMVIVVMVTIVMVIIVMVTTVMVIIVDGDNSDGVIVVIGTVAHCIRVNSSSDR